MEQLNLVDTAVQSINNRFVFHGISPDSECFVPLLEVRVIGSDISVSFLSFNLWDNGNPVSCDTVENLEKYLSIKIDTLRSVINHVTSAITPALASAVRL